MRSMRMIDGTRHVWSILDNAWVPESYWDWMAAQMRIQNLARWAALDASPRLRRETMATSDEGKALEAAIAEQQRIDRERADKAAADARARLDAIAAEGERRDAERREREAAKREENK